MGAEIGTCASRSTPREVPLPKEEVLEALAVSAARLPKLDLLLLAAKDAKALPEGAAGSSACPTVH